MCEHYTFRLPGDDRTDVMYALPSTSYVAEETESTMTRRHQSASFRRRLSERSQSTILSRATLLQYARTALLIYCLLGNVAGAISYQSSSSDLSTFSDAQKVRCFCDRRNCADQLMCDADYCLVGFKSDGKFTFCYSREKLACRRLEIITVLDSSVSLSLD